MSSGHAENGNSSLRSLPSVDELIRSAAGSSLIEAAGAVRSAALARLVIEELRSEMLHGSSAVDPSKEALLAEAQSRLRDAWKLESAAALRRVINATGVVIHTNLGRAPLSEFARMRVIEAAGYCNIEYDLTTGHRGRRGARAEELLCEFTGAEAAVVVNNCAAAALLVLSVFAEGQEVVISRGELVEIGGDFRVPDVLTRSGAILKEVGTTNRTKLSDYEKAIGFNTGVILRVHPSNFRIIGFTSMPETSELAALAHERGLIFIEDAGSGASSELTALGISDEPVISESIRLGVDIVTFSGDKLLGGPQSGLIVGRKELIDKVRRHPLYRALRVDKLIYAALEATLESHLRGTATDEIPVLKMLSATKNEIAERVRLFVERLNDATLKGITCEIVDGVSAVGGGAAPTIQPETALIAVSHSNRSADAIERDLRTSDPPVITRIAEGRVLIDLRTVHPADENDLFTALTRIGR